MKVLFLILLFSLNNTSTKELFYNNKCYLVYYNTTQLKSAETYLLSCECETKQKGCLVKRDLYNESGYVNTTFFLVSKDIDNLIIASNSKEELCINFKKKTINGYHFSINMKN